MSDDEDIQVNVRLYSATTILQMAFIAFGVGAIPLDYSRTTCLVGAGIFAVGIFISWLMGLHVAFFSLQDIEEEDETDEY